MHHKISNVKALPNYQLYVEFRDGAETLFDMSSMFDTIPAFRDFENIPGLFESVQVDASGYGVVWNDSLDFDSESLYYDGTVLKPAVVLSPGSGCPLCGQMIRRKSEAQRKASIANLAKRHSKGGRPINPDSKRQKRLREKMTTDTP